MIVGRVNQNQTLEDNGTVSYTHLRAHETKANLVCRLLLEKKKFVSANNSIRLSTLFKSSDIAKTYLLETC